MNGYHQMTIRLPYDVYLLLLAKAEEAKESMNALMVQAISESLQPREEAD